MATASAHKTTAIVIGAEGESGLVVRGLRAGIIASLAMAMVMMVLGLFDKGFFAAPSAIWAFWAGPAAYAPTSFSVSFILGAMGHMMNAAILGIVFALLASKAFQLSGTLASVATGTAFAIVVMAVMWIGILPLGPNGAIVRESASTAIWAAGHVAYGMALGVVYALWR